MIVPDAKPVATLYANNVKAMGGKLASMLTMTLTKMGMHAIPKGKLLLKKKRHKKRRHYFSSWKCFIGLSGQAALHNASD